MTVDENFGFDKSIADELLAVRKYFDKQPITINSRLDLAVMLNAYAIARWGNKNDQGNQVL